MCHNNIALASHLCTCVLHRQLCYLHTLKLPKFFNFHGDFHQKWHFAHPEFSFAHPELPFLAKSMHNKMLNANILGAFLAATKQLYEWFSPSVCLSVRLSVRPSVCHTFLTMFPSSYHHEIFRSYYQWQKWRPCKRSRSEVKGQGHRGHNPT